MAQELAAIATSVSPDEPCYLLVEVVLTPYEFSKGGTRFRLPSFVGRHRYEILWVKRNDELAEYFRDMGDAVLYDYPSLRIPSLWQHTVGELRDIAGNVRAKGSHEMKEMLANIQGESSLIEDAIRLAEQRQRWLRGRSSFGPAIAVQRS